MKIEICERTESLVSYMTVSFLVAACGITLAVIMGLKSIVESVANILTIIYET